MSVYKRGNVWWYKFRFQGQEIRDSSKSSSKTVARDAERARRRDLELGVNRIGKRDRIPLFKTAAEEWLSSKADLTPAGLEYYKHNQKKLIAEFGSRLVSDITRHDIAALQKKRVAAGKSGRTVNCEIATLRQVLKHFGLWAQIAGRVRFMREQTDAGRALSVEDEAKLLQEIGKSPSPSLLPFFILSLDAGLRPSEIRALRRRNLRLTWNKGAISEGEIVVGTSKTEAGKGRVVPLTSRARGALTLWWERFPEATQDSFLFPHHHVGVAHGEKPKSWMWGVDLDRPMTRASYKRAFDTARTNAKVTYRFYDARHTFVTRLAENPAVSIETIRQLAGHVSERMLSRYAHIRAQARRDAILTLESAQIPEDRVQKRAQSGPDGSSTDPRPVLN